MSVERIWGIYQTWKKENLKQNMLKDLEPSRLGKFRGGSSGCIGPKGVIYGTCPRRALARSWGYSEDSSDRDEMFETGKENEAIWERRIQSVLGPDSTIPEGSPESTIAWTLPDGRPVEGSPDLVVKGESEILLELKKICSVWTARKVSIHMFPKKEHMIQLAHYLGVGGRAAGVLIYTQDVSFGLPGVGKYPPSYLFPEIPGLVEYNEEDPRALLPHTTMYGAMIDKEGSVWYRCKSAHYEDSAWRPSLITLQGIHDYYQLTADQETNKVLANKPSRTSPFFGFDGKKAKADSSGPCDNCPLNGICADKAVTFDGFKSQVMTKVEEIKQSFATEQSPQGEENG